MKNYAKLGLGILAFGFLLSVLGAIVIRGQAPNGSSDSITQSTQSGAASSAKTNAAVITGASEASQTPQSASASSAPAAVQKEGASKP